MIRRLGIRARILLVSLAPAMMVGLLVTAVLVAEHAEQSHVEQHRRLSAVARQIAAAAEYNIFVGDDEALNRLIEAAQEEPDVIGAAILDAYGRVLASSVPQTSLPLPQEVIPDFRPPTYSEAMNHWHRQPIQPAMLADIDLYSGVTPETMPPPLQGELLLQVSNASLEREMRDFAIKALGVTLFVLALGALFALGLAHGLIGTLKKISGVVQAIRRGQVDARIGGGGGDELGQLATGIDEMADAVGQTQEILAERVRQTTAALRQERDEARAAAESRSRFFAAASHDLRQPVQALGLFVAHLEHDIADSPLLPRVRQIEKSVRNLQDLLDTLLDYSRLSGRVIRIEPRPAHSTELFANLFAEFAPIAEEKKLRLRRRIADCWLNTDRALLHRILINLLGNALRHTERGAVLVACRRGASHARIEVWDTGPGIPPEAQASIFDELVQLNNPERDASKGLGLGLAIVRRTADLLHHPIALCSRVGHGSRFTVVVPLADAPAIADETAEAAPPRRARDPLEDFRVMVVAPEAAQEELAALLDAWDCQVFVVADFAEAASWLASHAPPDVTLWEVGAGGTATACEALDRLESALRQPLPAIVVSAGPGPALPASAFGAPRLPLSRPFRPARLRALLGRAMDLGD